MLIWQRLVERAHRTVIIQEVFGVNDFIRATVEAYAAKGFVTAAPDIFWRLELAGVQLNPNMEEEFNRGIELMGQFVNQPVLTIYKPPSPRSKPPCL